MGNGGGVTGELGRGQGSEAGWGRTPALKDLPPMVPEVEDKEGPSSSKLITKKVTQPANRGSGVGMTAPDRNIPDTDAGKPTSASPVAACTPDQAKSETTVVEFSQDQTSEAPTGEDTADQTPSEAATGEAAVDQTPSEAAMEGATPDQTPSEEAVGGAEMIQTPPALCTDNQTPPASPAQGATTQISPIKLTENLRTLDLNSEAQVRPTTPR